MPVNDNTPILVGVGQVCSSWAGEDPAAAPSPMSLAEQAARRALDDCATRARPDFDVLALVRTNADSVPFDHYPFGRVEKPPRALARRLGANPKRAIYTDLGGETPQALVSEFAEEIFAGRSRMALLVGAEAMRAQKIAERAGIELDWSERADGDWEERPVTDLLITDYEIAGGLGYPTWVYALIEHALRARLGRDRVTHTAAMSELFAGFSKVAAANPYAQFGKERSAEFLATHSQANYHVADPYLKWHVAQDSVNQAAALVVTSVGTARELGIPEEKWVYLHGYARAREAKLSQRHDVSRSRAMEKAARLALDSSGLAIEEIDHFDLYSCFPCAVFLAAEALGVDWRSKVLTQTGGLPFFGGPGNNYSMHGIASMAERLRADRGSRGLVVANGGFVTKEAIAVYSTEAPKQWAPVSSAALQAEIDAEAGPPLVATAGPAVVETFTVVFRRDEPQFATVIGRRSEERIIARTASGDRATPSALLEGDPIGATVEIVVDDEGKRSLKL
jgi:acetyl-CoA C-acetyltransferase